MNSPVASPDKAFTLIELLLSSSLIMIVGLFMFPLSITFYRTQILNETREGLQSVLVRAQDFSRTGKGGGSYGVAIQDTSYLLFEGESFALRDETKDEVYPISSSIEVSDTEIVFAPFSGKPNTEAIIQLRIEDLSAFVGVSAAGVIYTY